jgi:hypothetical protein
MDVAAHSRPEKGVKSKSLENQNGVDIHLHHVLKYFGNRSARAKMLKQWKQLPFTVRRV